MQAGPLVSRQRARLLETSQAYGLQAFLLAFAGLAVVASQALEPESWLLPGLTPEIWLGLVLGSASLIAIGAWSLLRYPGFGRKVGLLGLVAFGFVVGPGLAASPGRALVVLLVVGAVGQRLRGYAVEREGRVPTDPEMLTDPRLFSVAAESTSLASLAAWFLVAATGLATGFVAHWAAVGVFGVSAVYTAVWVQRSWRRESGRARWSFVVLLVFPVLALVSWQRPALALTWLALFEIVTLGLLFVRRSSTGTLWSEIVEHPARLLVTTFAALALVGGIVLSLPICTTRPEGIAVVDAFFTSVSATCITGLTTLDTATDFTPFGQVVILVLSQLGALGIMTFSTAGVLLLGRRLGLRHEVAVGGLLTDEGGGDLFGAARRILVTTFVCELVGAAALSGLYLWHGEPPERAVWHGVFTSVSAFCNAGFMLRSDGLIGYQDDSLILFAVVLLVMAGGLGTPVLHAIPGFFRRRPVSLQARLVLWMTVILVALPLPIVAALEWDHAFGHLGLWDKLVNALFQTITPRSAGLTTVDFTQLQPATVTLMMGLMFIGGSPFSTAGGVKVTTIALIGLGVLAVVRGRPEATAFGRRISHESIYKSIAIMTMGTLFVGVAFVAVQVTQRLPFEVGLFEVVSALGTVGLSIGGTARLDGLGKIIVMVCMFAGRVGPVTLFLLLQERRRAPKWVFPEEKVAVG